MVTAKRRPVVGPVAGARCCTGWRSAAPSDGLVSSRKETHPSMKPSRRTVSHISSIRFDAASQTFHVKDAIQWLTQRSSTTVRQLYRSLSPELRTQCAQKAHKFPPAPLPQPCTDLPLFRTICEALKVTLTPRHEEALTGLWHDAEEGGASGCPGAITSWSGAFAALLTRPLNAPSRQLIDAFLKVRQAEIEVESKRLDHQLAAARKSQDSSGPDRKVTGPGVRAPGVGQGQAGSGQKRKAPGSDTTAPRKVVWEEVPAADVRGQRSKRPAVEPVSPRPIDPVLDAACATLD